MSDSQRIALMVNKLSLEAEHGRIEDEWVCSFLADMKTRLKLGHPITRNMIHKLEELFERY